MIAKSQPLKTDKILGRNQKYLGINPHYHFSLQTKCEPNQKMFQTGKGSVGINVFILKKTLSVVALKETLYLHECIDIFAINVSFIQSNTLISGYTRDSWRLGVRNSLILVPFYLISNEVH